MYRSVARVQESYGTDIDRAYTRSFCDIIITAIFVLSCNKMIQFETEVVGAVSFSLSHSR